MTPDGMWKLAGLTGDCDAWAFGDDPDGLAALILAGRKTATASAYPLYEAEGEPLPRAGEAGVVLDGQGGAVCVIRTTRVYVVPFRDVSARHAAMEGEGGLSLEYWRTVHRRFFTGELAAIGQRFDEDMPVVCEEFERIWPADAPDTPS